MSSAAAAKSLPIAIHLRVIEGELESEARRFGMNAVRSAHHDRPLVLACSAGEDLDQAIDCVAEDVVCTCNPHHPGGIHHIGRREPVVHPLLLLAEGLADGPREGHHVVPRLLLDLVNAAMSKLAFAYSVSTSSFGITPISDQPAQAASSTSSHDWNCACSLQSSAISGRV
jgi:hypothetical protein